MRKKIFITVTVLTLSILFLIFPSFVSSSEHLSYLYLVELGKDALAERDYAEAIHYFELACQVDPSSEEARFYINFTKRLKDGRLEDISPLKKEITKSFREKSDGKNGFKKRKEGVISRTLDLFEMGRVRREKDKAERVFKRKSAELEEIGVFEYKTTGVEDGKISKRKSRLIDKTLALIEKKIAKRSKKSVSAEKKGFKKTKILLLTDELWAQQPVTTFELEIGESFILKGNNIKRFLVISPDLLEIEKIDENTLNVSSGARKGTTYFHVWDEKGRWTFYINLVFLPDIQYLVGKDMVEEMVDPFIFNYSVDWSSYSRGKSLDAMNRQSLSFSQWVQLLGETPYGEFDASAAFVKFKKTTEVSTYTVGLTDGRIGNFKNFDLRGFDFYKSFSWFSLPGVGMRGVLLEGKINDFWGYDFVWGNRKPTYGFVTAGSTKRRKEYLQGMKLTFSPSPENEYSFNYARGYGSERDKSLNDQVVALQVDQNIGDINLSSEYGFNGDSSAAIFNSSLGRDNLILRFDLRDIEKDYTTVTGRAAGQGEVGCRAVVEYTFPDSYIRFISDADMYRDRTQLNPDNREKFNLNWNSSLYVPLSSSSNWMSSFYYLDTPGLYSPREDIRINNTYSKRMGIFGNRDLSWFLGNTYQRSRSSLSPASDHNRYSLFGGMQFPLIEDLSYFLNYESFWVEECISGTEYSPRALTTGINYYKQFFSSLSGSLNVSYRDEENTGGLFSFLAGEDSLRVNLGLTYRPSSDFEFFINGSVTDIWAENPGRDAYNTFDIRWGIRTSWDFPFRWNPQGEVKGVVFKDMNGNMEKDEDEEGIPGVKVKVGKKEVITDAGGEYNVKIKAKRVTVTVDIESVPEDYVFSTSPLETIEIVHKKSSRVDFGLTTQSGIYGVVFYDADNDGKPGIDDIFLSEVKIILDESNIVSTNSEGTYFFRGLGPGKHTLKIDINSIPLEYLPRIKVVSEIDLSEGKTYIFHVPLTKKD